METVNFFFKNSGGTLSFVFKAHKNSDEAYKRAVAEPSFIEIEDDFGLKATIDMDSVAAITINEVEKDMYKQGQLQILQAKADLKTQSEAKNDIGLQMLSRSTGGIINQ